MCVSVVSEWREMKTETMCMCVDSDKETTQCVCVRPSFPPSSSLSCCYCFPAKFPIFLFFFLNLLSSSVLYSLCFLLSLSSLSSFLLHFYSFLFFFVTCCLSYFYPFLPFLPLSFFHSSFFLLTPLTTY